MGGGRGKRERGGRQEGKGEKDRKRETERREEEGRTEAERKCVTLKVPTIKTIRKTNLDIIAALVKSNTT